MCMTSSVNGGLHEIDHAKVRDRYVRRCGVGCLKLTKAGIINFLSAAMQY